MNQNPNHQTQPESNIFSVLNEKEKEKLIDLVISADEKYMEYKEELKKILDFLRDLRLKFGYLSEEGGQYEEVYIKVDEVVEKFENLIHDLKSPYWFLNRALEK